MLTIDPGAIAELGTQVATHGAIGGAGLGGDDLFQMIIAIAILIYEMYPNPSR
jgi:hypothetical protein